MSQNVLPLKVRHFRGSTFLIFSVFYSGLMEKIFVDAAIELILRHPSVNNVMFF